MGKFEKTKNKLKNTRKKAKSKKNIAKDSEEDNYIIEAAINLLESRKLTKNAAICLACGSVIHKGAMLICTDCLDEECSSYYDKTEK